MWVSRMDCSHSLADIFLHEIDLQTERQTERETETETETERETEREAHYMNQSGKMLIKQA